MSGILYPIENEQSESQKIDDFNNRNKLLYLLLTELSQNKSIKVELRNKLHDTLVHYKVKQTTKISIHPGTTHDILGLSGIEAPTFTSEEQNLLCDMVNERLNYYANKDRDHKKEDICTDKLLLESRENLNKIMTSYANNLLEFQRILDSMKDLQLKNLPELCANKHNESNIKLELNKSKYDLINATAQVNILTETEVSLEAYKDMVKLIQREQEEYKMKIAHRKEEKGKYQMVDCKEYQEILKEYLQYINSIEKIHQMKKILKQIN